MRRHRVFLLGLIAAQFAPVVVLAFNLERAKVACTPEVIRLCTFGEKMRAAAGSYDGVIDCLRRERARVSRACRRELGQYEAPNK